MQINPYHTRIHKPDTLVPTLKIHYFGSLRIELNGSLLALRTTKTAALLAYLALEGKQPQPRTHLAALLWDGYETQTARSSLRVALTYLRRALLPLQPLRILHKCVQWDSSQAAIWCDVRAFEEVVVHQVGQLSPAHLQEAMTLGKSEFLAGWENVDSLPFQKWVLKRRVHYQTLFTNFLQQRSTTHFTTGAKPISVPPNRHNLLRPLTPLIGRTEIVNELQQMLLESQHPLLVLVGEGGIGKTRLALAVAWLLVNTNSNKVSSVIPNQRTTGPFPDGIWFIPLGELVSQTITNRQDQIERVATAISMTLSLRLTETESVSQQLLTWLREKSLLLILDGIEQLTGADAFLGMLLQTAYGVKVLVTSRRRPNLQAATIFPVQELATPDEATAATATVEQLQSYPSIQLFVERAQRIRMDFQLDQQNGATIAQLCRLVGGMPLGIELAAAMMTIYSAPMIAEQLRNDAVTLQMTWADLSPWHRNIEQMLATSWQLLTAEEARFLAQCTVISGSFNLAIATRISGATPVVLRTLVEKSLLRQHNLEPDRFTMHELVRHYAHRQLQQMPALEAHTRARHAIFYLTLLQEQEAALPNEQAAQQIITAELENIRAAWAWSCRTNNIALLENACEALAWYYRVTAFDAEALISFEQAATALAKPLQLDDSNDKRQARLRTQVLLKVSEFGRKLSRLEQSQQVLHEAHAMSQQLGDAMLLALTYKERALMAQAQGDYANLMMFAKQSVEFAEQTENLQVKLVCQMTLAAATAHSHHYAQAYDIYFTIYQSLQALPNRYLQASIATDLGGLYTEQHEYTLALNEFQHALNCQQALEMPIIHYTYIKLGYLWYELGMFESAQNLFTQAATFLQTNHYPFWQIAVQRGLGLLQQVAGNRTAAHQHMTTALKLAQEQHHAQLEYQILIDQGDILMTMDAGQEALACYERALRLCERLGDTARAGDAQAALAKLRLTHQELAAAQRAVDLALTTFAQQGLQAAWHPFRAYWCCYQVLQALADPRATPFLKKAHSKLMQIAQHIQDQAHRHAFLHNIPDHHAIVDAMDGIATTEYQEGLLLPEQRPFSAYS